MAEWLENDAQWYEQQMLFCALCGRMIAKHYLRAEVDAERLTFCSEGCHDLYNDYWLVERGRDYHPSANVHELYTERVVK